MRKIWFSKTWGWKKRYLKEISLENTNPLFDIWFEKDNCTLEDGNLNFYAFRIAVLKIRFSVFANIFHNCNGL